MPISGPFERFADGAPVGDVIPFWYDGVYHLYILAPEVGALYFPERLKTAWRHLVSTDLITWQERPIALKPGVLGEPDDGGVWTGSVVRSGDQFHIFYTGHRVDGPQTVCHATSSDADTWLKDTQNPVSCSPGGDYEDRDWRDPFLFWDPQRGVYTMLLTARRGHGPAITRGTLVQMESEDLLEWGPPEPFLQLGMTHAPECPELFELGDRWILGSSSNTGRRGTTYRVAAQQYGPFSLQGRDGPDGRYWYAAKSLTDDDGRRIAFGWIPDRHPDVLGRWLWGGSLALPRLLSIDDAGALAMSPAPAVRALAGAVCELTPVHASQPNGTGVPDRIGGEGEVALQLYEAGARPSIVLEVRFSATRSAGRGGVLLSGSDELDSGVGIFWNPKSASVQLIDLHAKRKPGGYAAAFDQWAPVVTHTAANLSSEIDFEIYVRGDIVEAFIGDGLCLSYRAEGPVTRYTGWMVEDGTCVLDSFRVRTLAGGTSATEIPASSKTRVAHTDGPSMM